MSLSLFISEAYAQTAGAVPAPAGPSMQDAFVQIAQMVLIFGVLYFFLIYPQQKKFKQHKAMLEALRRGDRVVTGGGIVGTVIKVEEGDEVTVEIADNVKVRIVKSTITAVQAKGDAPSGEG